MNSTEQTSREAEAKKVYFEQLLPVAQRLQARGRELLTPGPDASAASYYVQRPRKELGPADFEVPTMADPAGVRAALEKLWRDQGDAELAALAPALVELARAMRQIEGQSAEVSPFIYVMF